VKQFVQSETVYFAVIICVRGLSFFNIGLQLFGIMLALMPGESNEK